MEQSYEELTDTYTNPLGKSRPREPIVSRRETDARLNFFREIEPTIRAGLIKKGVKPGEIKVVGSTAYTASTDRSDLDLKILAQPGVTIEDYNRLVRCGKELLEELNKTSKYKLDFWFRQGTESTEKHKG